MDQEWIETFDEVYKDRIAPSDITARRDTLRERAYAARNVLVNVAEDGSPGDQEGTQDDRSEHVLEYGELADQIGSNASYMWKVLGTIDCIGTRLGDPILSPLVVSAGTVGPGRGYFKWEFHDHCCMDYTTRVKEDDGWPPYKVDNPDDKSSLTNDMKIDWKEELRQAYAYEGWYQTGE